MKLKIKKNISIRKHPLTDGDETDVFKALRRQVKSKKNLSRNSIIKKINGVYFDTHDSYNKKFIAIQNGDYVKIVRVVY